MQLKLFSSLPLTGTLLSLSLISGALAFSEPCKQGLSYCGSTLLKYHDYTSDDLRNNILAGPNSRYKIPSIARPANALYRCDDDQGNFSLREFCLRGCETPPNGDACAVEI